MPLQKNQVIPLSIESLSSDGNGVGHFEGQAVFVPATAPGDMLKVRIVKPLARYAFGKVEELLEKGPGRVDPDCPSFGPCGGCSLRHLSYTAECDAKTAFVREAFARIGGLDIPVLPIVPAPDPLRYRNKVQLPVGRDAVGHILTGFYAGRSHRIVPCPDCRLQPEWMNQLAARACELMEQFSIESYQEETGKGLVRHLYMRQGWHSGQRLLCFVLNGLRMPHEEELCRMLQQEFQLTTILINTNTQRTNVILGQRTRTVLGPGVIEDTLAGVPLKMGVHEFYQVNTPAAEALYAKARELATLRPSDLLLDLYCGMGTIGLSMKSDCRTLIGVEVVAPAVKEARQTARRLGLQEDQARFLCMDAGAAASRLAEEGLHPDVIVVDPPRKGCDDKTLSAIAAMAPRTVVMISCNPATAARDVKTLYASGYRAETVQPFDLFPRTRHVETVVLLSRAISEHQMRLSPEPFEMIKSGRKTIELRLWDEKRQKVKTGDTILFTNTVTGKPLRTKVLHLHRFHNFEELYHALPLFKCGYTEETLTTAKASDMEKYYSAGEQLQYGVVGIELALSPSPDIS